MLIWAGKQDPFPGLLAATPLTPAYFAAKPLAVSCVEPFAVV
jgi:hypothetical protein